MSERARTVLITDCDMGEATFERAVLEPAGFDVVHERCRTEDEIIDAARATGACALLVQYGPITRGVLESCPDVRVVARYGVGMDNVDVDAAAELGVEARNVRGYGSAEVADQAMALLLPLLRRVPAWSQPVRAGEWPVRGDVPDPRELLTCALGLFGFGAVAQAVAARAKAFGMTVVAHDPYVDGSAAGEAGVEMVSWDDLWERSDAVSVHAPLTEKTRGTVDRRVLASLGPDGILVNTARAGLVDRPSLERALDAGDVTGVGLDVWWEEPAHPDDPLLADPRVLTTPHVAWISPGSVQRLRTAAAQIARNVLQKERGNAHNAGHNTVAG
ncbi:C-terminal binding protein [Phytoactinopolyspora halotolerans]|uniref:C-terminal binding protein n=1 Tax=Phytoactinopolyspora halotolerans TaxID=1981512 RepID=A0A6L9S1N4_9ACTN|nr:C-terminal binding protein [Phytoactinopolyspora halotolerans]NED98563.1 C-terminal binding protein [Phytoactinopolyspora halotolerans]